MKAGKDGTALSLILAHGLSSSSPTYPRPASPSPAPTVQTTQGKHQQGLAKTYIRAYFVLLSITRAIKALVWFKQFYLALTTLLGTYIQFSFHFPITSKSLSFFFLLPGTACHAQVNKHKLHFLTSCKTLVLTSTHCISDLIPTYVHQDVTGRFRTKLIFLSSVNALSVLGLHWTHNIGSISTFSQHFPWLYLIPYMWKD